MEGKNGEAVLENMHILIPLSTAGNGLWEIDKWEMGFGWLRYFEIANARE